VKIKLLIGILVALIVLNLATIGSFVYMRWRAPERDLAALAPRADRDFARPRDDRRGSHRPFHPSGDERRQLIGLLREFQSETVGIRQKIFEDEKEVFDLMQMDTVPRSTVDSLLEEISESRLEMRRMAVDKLIESKAHLSPMQQQRFFDSILQTRPGGRGGRGWHQHERRGPQRTEEPGGERL
jgi:uncharacterized membrane protein